MYPSSALCRVQQSIHSERAASAVLENVQMIARKAALAWEREAISAERREERQIQTRATAELLATQKVASDDGFDGLASENPDRGHAERLGVTADD